MYVIDELRRFRMLVAGIYVGLAISSFYGFSIFTEHMKTKYRFTQGDITTISTVGNCCVYLFYGGIVFDYAGPKITIFVAGFVASIGYILYGLAFDGVIDGDNMLIKFCVINALACIGCPGMDVGALMSMMLNFPLERGYMVIIQKTFGALGTSVLMAYFNGWFSNVDTPADSLYSPYSYFLAGHILLCVSVGAYFIDLPPYYPCQRAKARMSEEEKQQRDALVPLYMQQHAPLRRLHIGCALVVVCLIFLTTTSIVTGYVNTSKTAYVILSVITVLLLACFSLMALPFQCLGAYNPPESSHPSFKCIGIVTLATEGDPVCSRPSTPSAMEEEPIADADHSPGDLPAPPADKVSLPQEDPATSAPPLNSVGDPQYPGSFWRNLLSLELWLLWLSLFGMWGTATVMQMNATQIYRSKNHGVYDPARLTLYIAMCGVGSAIGRATSGILDMWLTVKKQRGETTMLLTIFFPCGSLCLCLAYLLFAVIPANGLILPFLLGSIGNGLGWGLGALSVRILFAKDVGKHYNFLFSSGFLSTILLNRVMFGTMFDRQAEKEGTSPFCNHPFCVRNQMWILMAVNGMSTVAAIGVHLRYSRFVRHQRDLWATNPASGMEADTTEVLTDAVEDSAPSDASEEPRNE